MIMFSQALRLSAILSIAATLPALAQSGAAGLMIVRHASGQAVAPVYEGFDINADGSFNMWFGYMNRNYEEEIDLPVGPDNAFTPGFDRGQPTHFSPRRHKDVFSVTVPKDFGDQALVRTLTVRGETQKVTGTLKPVWQIDRRRTTRGGNSERISSNLPSAVEVRPSEDTLAAHDSLTLTISATDDGLPRRRGEPIGMTATWDKYRGPGTVTFSAPVSRLTGGKSSTTVTFSEPGEYLLQAVV